MSDLREAASSVGHIRNSTNPCDCMCAGRLEAMAVALSDTIAAVRQMLADAEPAPYAPVTPLHTRIVPEPRLRPGETLQQFWDRADGAVAQWPAKNVVPLTADEEQTP